MATNAPTPMPLSTANWHWKNKNVSPWAKGWFERELGAVEVAGESGEALTIESVDRVEGDAELGQRKSKLITIYDCKIELKWVATAADGTEAKGTLTVPEVSHEMPDGLSDYVYEWGLTTSTSKEVDALYRQVKARLPSTLEKIFNSFPAAMIDAHGRDIQIGTPGASGTSTPVTAGVAASATPASTAAAAAKPEPKAKTVNTSSVKATATFAASADDLFSLLTDEKRIPAWSRAPAVSTAQPNSEYSLFGGGVKGKYVSLTPGKEIVQTWVLSSPSWPSDHSATLTTTLEQSDDSTKVTFSLSGVPKGMEDEIQRNIEGYYVHGFKSIGYVQLYLSTPSEPSSSRSAKHARSVKSATVTQQQSDSASSSQKAFAIGVAVLALATAFSLPYFYK